MRRLALPLAALCAGLLFGCGDDGEEGPRRTVTLKSGRELRVAGNEYRFDPQRVVVLGTARREPVGVRIRLSNEGALAHNLKVFRGDEELGGTPTFQGGRAESGSVRLRPGKYRMVCTVGNHADLGMVGELEVRVR
jgi:plastocyanin